MLLIESSNRSTKLFDIASICSSYHPSTRVGPLNLSPRMRIEPLCIKEQTFPTFPHKFLSTTCQFKWAMSVSHPWVGPDFCKSGRASHRSDKTRLLSYHRGFLGYPLSKGKMYHPLNDEKCRFSYTVFLFSGIRSRYFFFWDKTMPCYSVLSHFWHAPTASACMYLISPFLASKTINFKMLASRQTYT